MKTSFFYKNEFDANGCITIKTRFRGTIGRKSTHKTEKNRIFVVHFNYLNNLKTEKPVIKRVKIKKQ